MVDTRWHRHMKREGEQGTPDLLPLGWAEESSERSKATTQRNHKCSKQERNE